MVIVWEVIGKIKIEITFTNKQSFNVNNLTGF